MSTALPSAWRVSRRVAPAELARHAGSAALALAAAGLMLALAIGLPDAPWVLALLTMTLAGLLLLPLLGRLIDTHGPMITPLVLFSAFLALYTLPLPVAYLVQVYSGQEIGLFFLGDVALNLPLQIKGVVVSLLGLLGYLIGYRLAARPRDQVFEPRATTLRVPRPGAYHVVVSACLLAAGLLLPVGIYLYGWQDFLAGYTVGDLQLRSLGARQNLGMGIIAFATELAVGALSLALVAWLARREGRGSLLRWPYFYVFLALLGVMLLRGKRLEVLVMFVNVFLIFDLFKAVTRRRLALWALLVFLFAGLVGVYRLSQDIGSIGIGSLESNPLINVSLEGAFTYYSLLASINLVDSSPAVPYLAGGSFVDAAANFIPRFIYPDKDALRMEFNWFETYAANVNLSPLGAFFLFAILYINGNVYFVAGFTLGLGWLSAWVYGRAMAGLRQGRLGFWQLLYMTSLPLFYLHLLRDSVASGTKSLFQAGVLPILLLLLVTHLPLARRPAGRPPASAGPSPPS